MTKSNRCMGGLTLLTTNALSILPFRRRKRRRSNSLSLSRLWYAVPPTKGGTTDGQYTVHRCAGAPLRIPGFDQLDARGVSTVSPALRDGVPSASSRVAPRWEAAHRPPVHSLQALSLANAGRSTVLHS